MKKLDKRLILSRALMYTGFCVFGVCVSVIDSALLLGGIGTLVGILMMLAASGIEAGR